MAEKPMNVVFFMKQVFITLICILGLQLLTGGGYLFFHTVVETACVVIGLIMFFFARSTYSFSRNRYLLFLGWAYFYVAILDFFHLITFSGMGVFPGLTMNVPTQFWIAGRTLEGISLFLFPMIIVRPFPQRILNVVYGVLTGFGVLAIMRLKVFPVCYVDGVGLTTFKVGAEYGICILLGLGMYFLWKRKNLVPQSIFNVTMASMVCTIVAELIFTLYKTLDLWNILGHIPKIISYYLILWGVIIQGLEAPYQLIFKELKEKNQQLELLNDKKNKFLGIAAHDLRNPLSIITMSTQILQRSTNIDEKQTKFLQRIKTSSEYMLRLVEELLDLAKIEAGNMHLNLQIGDLANMIEHTVSLNQTLAGNKDIHLIYTYEQGIPPITFDPLKMEQVVNNLISNAIKYSHPGSNVHITLQQKSDQVMLKVEDHGQGIPAHELPMIFTPYAKISTQATAGEKSTGLGLSISLRIVEGHRGQIWVESELGQGTTFYVTLPIELTHCSKEGLTS